MRRNRELKERPWFCVFEEREREIECIWSKLVYLRVPCSAANNCRRWWNHYKAWCYCWWCWQTQSRLASPAASISKPSKIFRILKRRWIFRTSSNRWSRLFTARPSIRPIPLFDSPSSYTSSFPFVSISFFLISFLPRRFTNAPVNAIRLHEVSATIDLFSHGFTCSIGNFKRALGYVEGVRPKWNDLFSILYFNIYICVHMCVCVYKCVCKYVCQVILSSSLRERNRNGCSAALLFLRWSLIYS